MTVINRITLINDLKKKKEEEEEGPFKIAKIKPLTAQVGLGIGAKATGGITLPEPTMDIIELGNINLNNRPVVKNPKTGEISTVLSKSFNFDGVEVLIPTVVNGKIVSDQEAIDWYRKTGQHLGKFKTIEAANKYAEQLHLDQEKLYSTESGGGGNVGAMEGKPISEIESVTGYNPEVGAKETKELTSILQGSANAKKQLDIQWSKEYEESTDKKSFLKGIGQSSELKRLWGEVTKWDKTLSENNINISDWVQTGVYAGYFALLAADILPILSQLPANILNNLAYKVENKTVKGQDLKDILWKAAYSKTTEFERKVFDKFVSEGGLSGIGGNLQKGISITETVPRFAFAGKLYAGLPADEIAKSIVAVGKVTAEAVKGLDPVKVSQVTQMLLNTSPALASEFLKAIEKRETIFKVMTFEEYASSKGSGFLSFSEPALQRQPGATEKEIQKNAKMIQQKGEEWIKQRDILREEYNEKIASGEIREPTRIESLIKNARGHPDNESTKAARRLLDKQGIDWKVEPEPAKVTPPAEPKEELKAKGKEPLFDKILKGEEEVPDKIDKKIRDILDKDKELLAIHKQYTKTTMPGILGSGDKSLLGKESELYVKKYNELLKEELKAQPQPTTITPPPTEQYTKVPATIEEAKEILKVDPKKPSQPKESLAKQMIAKKVSLADIEAVKGEKIDVTKPKDIIVALKDIKAVKKEVVVEPTPKAIPKEFEPLAEEARKFGSAEEFGNNTLNYIPTKTGKLVENISDPSNWKDLTIRKLIDLKNNNPDFIVSAKLVSGGRGGVSRQNIAIKNLLLPDNLTDFYAQATAGTKAEGKVEAIVKPAEAVTEKPAVVEAPAPAKPEVELATPAQINKAYSIAKTKAMVSENDKLKPQYRKVAEAMTGKTHIEDMTPEEAEIFIDALNRLPEPKYRDGKLIPPSIPRTTKLTTEGFFQKQYGEPTPIWLLTDQTYYAEKLGIKPLVEPFEKGKQEFDLEFRKSSNLVDRMVNKLNQIAKTPGLEKFKSKVKNIPTKAEGRMAELLNKHEATPSGLSQDEEDIFKYFRNLSKDIWRRENEVRGKLDLPPIKYKTAYFRHTADAMAKEMLEGKYPFPQGIKYWSEKIVGKKIFNPMEFHRKLSDDLIDLWSKDIRAVTKAMLWNGLKEIHLAEPAKFLNEQLNAISKDLPEYKNLTPREQAAYDQTKVIPASTKKWLIDYINQVLKGQETELDASLNRIVTKSGLKGIFDKVLSPFGRAVGRKPITNLFSLSGRMTISGVMGWIPRQLIRNTFQQVQNLALYGVQATIKSFLPVSVDKNLKELLSDSLFLKSYTGFEELPTNLMGKLERVWLAPYGWTAIWNAGQGMKAAYWNILELIKNPKFKKFGWADPQRTKDTPKDYLYPSEKEKLLKEMEFGSSCTQYQYIPIGMPGVFRYKALIPLTRLQSWWMNYFAKFNTEAFNRLRKGETSYGAKLPWSRRVNWAKYLIIGGAILTALGYRKSFMLGVLPGYLSPAGQLGLGFYNYTLATSDWQKTMALRQIKNSWTAFIPGSLAWKDFVAVWNGEKDLEEVLFYGKTEKKKKVEPTVIGKPSISKITIPKINKIKINKISPIKIKF